jgi:hypothetical protein
MSTAQTRKVFVEQRQFPRHRVDSPAWVDFGDGALMRRCTLWDVSENGARIVIEEPADVPTEFLLILSADGTARRRCRIIWRSDNQIGALYLAAPDWNWTS